MEVDNTAFIEAFRKHKRAMLDIKQNFKLCVEPNAPYKPCCVCGCSVKTCEREEAVNNSYICPAHPNGSELSDGRWVCSDECWEKATSDD